jgi:hypothetical protein
LKHRLLCKQCFKPASTNMLLPVSSSTPMIQVLCGPNVFWIVVWLLCLAGVCGSTVADVNRVHLFQATAVTRFMCALRSPKGKPINITTSAIVRIDLSKAAGFSKDAPA